MGQEDLINSEVHKKYDILIIQEPYIDTYRNTKATKEWRVRYLTSRLSNSDKTRSVILVNAALDTNYWSQVSIPGSNDLMAIQMKDNYSRFTIINIYNDCNNSKALETLDTYLKGNCWHICAHDTDYMLWCRDFN
jgi:hypothetical protein